MSFTLSANISRREVVAGAVGGVALATLPPMAGAQAAGPATEVSWYDNRRLYPIDMALRYEIPGRRSGLGSVAGCGRTTQVGSRSVVFISDRVLEVNRKIRLVIDWPVPLPDGVALRFWAFGTIVEVESNIVLVAFSPGEFRTCGTNLSEEGRGLCP